jgi:hypothetical protein
MFAPLVLSRFNQALGPSSTVVVVAGRVLDLALVELLPLLGPSC